VLQHKDVSVTRKENVTMATKTCKAPAKKACTPATAVSMKKGTKAPAKKTAKKR
jgi:hypothetical protein